MKKAILLAAVLSLGTWVLAQTERIIAGPVVESATQNSATIAWSTDTGGNSIVHYGTNPGNLNQTAQSPYVAGSSTHRVALKNLRPNTMYYFYVESGQGQGTGTMAKSGVGQFQTLGEQDTKVPLFRMRGPGGAHFYATSYAEEQRDEKSGWQPEGTIGYVLKNQAPGTAPLYRLRGPKGSGDHFFTDNPQQVAQAQRLGYQMEGVAGYVATSQQPDTTPLFDLYDAAGKLHFYTTNAGERNSVLGHGYRDAAIAGYVWQH
jgi:hypothetical protein